VAGTVNVTVNTAPLTITANNDSKTYGQTRTDGPGSSAFTSSGLQNLEKIGTVTITASGGTAANAAMGGYELIPSGATGGTFTSSNYTISYNRGALIVTQLPVQLSGSRSYDGSATASASILTVANVVPGDSVTVASGTAILSGSNVGVQTIKSFAGLILGGSSANNYTLVNANGTVAITQPPLSIVEPLFTSKSTFQLSILTELGTTYVLVYTDSLGSGSWTPTGNPIVGNGQTVTLEDPAPSGSARFYLVRSQ
jgi:trimeric autotransporter adhesin